MESKFGRYARNLCTLCSKLAIPSQMPHPLQFFNANHIAQGEKLRRIHGLGCAVPHSQTSTLSNPPPLRNGGAAALQGWPCHANISHKGSFQTVRLLRRNTLPILGANT